MAFELFVVIFLLSHLVVQNFNVYRTVRLFIFFCCLVCFLRKKKGGGVSDLPAVGVWAVARVLSPPPTFPPFFLNSGDVSFSCLHWQNSYNYNVALLSFTAIYFLHGLVITYFLHLRKVRTVLGETRGGVGGLSPFVPLRIKWRDPRRHY